MHFSQFKYAYGHCAVEHGIFLASLIRWVAALSIVQFLLELDDL